MNPIKRLWQRWQVHHLVRRGRDWSDRAYLQRMGQIRLCYHLDLKNPQTLCEKLNWLKIYDRQPLYTTMVDKAAVKIWAARRIGAEYTIETYGVWDTFDAINFADLPDQFVLKCTHDAGSTIVVTDRHHFNRAAARRKLNRALRYNYAARNREWPYQNVPPRIMAEAYLPVTDATDGEYDFTCLNGKVTLATIYRNINGRHPTADVYDPQGHHVDCQLGYPNAAEPPVVPPQWTTMIQLAEKLATAAPFLRIDFWLSRGKIKLEELTFFPWGGFIPFVPTAWDLLLGAQLSLPAPRD